MEQMATKDDIKKVAMICDRGYTEKANSRKGGAGTEAQIITPQIYASQDQSKFVAVFSERDDEGKPYVPAFYSSRIYIDLSDPTTYGTGFEELVRWAFDKPLYVKPALGKPPAYILDNAETVRLATSIYQKKAIEAIRSGRPNAPAILSEYFDKLLDEMEKFRLKGANISDFDIEVFKSIDEFLPYRNEFLEALSVATAFIPTEDTASRLHKFFEKLIRYMYRTESMTGYSSWDFDNYRFISYEMYLSSLAIFIKYEQYGMLRQIIETEYFVGTIPDVDGNEMMGPEIFMHHLESFEKANNRTESRKITKVGDVLHSRSKHTFYEFRHLCTADVILHLRDRIKNSSYLKWYAVTPIYLAYSRSSLEAFARSRSQEYFNKILPIIGVASADEFRNLVTRLQSTERGGFGFGHYHRGSSLSNLVNSENVGTSP